MSEREKLIGILSYAASDAYSLDTRRDTEELADFLLANGVIVPTVKVGQTVYEIDYDFESESFEVVQSSVRGFEVSTTYNFHHLEDCHETLYLSREDAERALAEKENKDG